jgi:hypothetical protein
MNRKAVALGAEFLSPISASNAAFETKIVTERMSADHPAAGGAAYT